MNIEQAVKDQYLGDIQRGSCIYDTQGNRIDRTTSHKGPKIRCKDLQQSATHRDDICNNQWPFATQVEIHWRSKQTSDDGSHQWKREDQILIASREDIFSSDWVRSLEFLNLHWNQLRSPVYDFATPTKPGNAATGEMILSSNPNKKDAAPNIVQAKINRALIAWDFGREVASE